MAVGITPRLGLTTWSAGADPFTRNQMDSSHQALEAKAAGYLQGTEAARPVAAAQYEGFIYFATDFPSLSYCDGSDWQSFNTFDVPTTLAMGDAPSEGTGPEIARATHVHGMPAFGGAGADVAAAAAAGGAATPSRSDHVHKIGSGAINLSTMFATGVINANAMGALSVATAAIQAGAVTAGKIGALAVATGNIQDDAVTDAKLDSVGKIDAALIVSKASSTIEAAAIPGLPGEIITSGTINPARLPSLPTPPVGAGSLWFSATPPSGYILLQGQELSRTTYADIYGLWGEVYGSGNGTTTFNAPDTRGRFLIGKADSGTAGTLGAQFGSLDHTHTISSHTHGIGTHSHTFGSHTHTIPAHSHTIGAHTHAGPSHRHGLNLHTHAGSTHTHGFGQTSIDNSSSHSHSTGSPSNTVNSDAGFYNSASAGHTHSISSAGTHSHGISGSTGTAGGASGGAASGFTEYEGTGTTGSGSGSTDNSTQGTSGGSSGSTDGSGGNTDTGTGPSATASNNPPTLVIHFIAFTGVYV